MMGGGVKSGNAAAAAAVGGAVVWVEGINGGRGHPTLKAAASHCLHDTTPTSSVEVVIHWVQPVVDAVYTKCTASVAGSTTSAPPNSVRLFGSAKMACGASQFWPLSMLRRMYTMFGVKSVR